MPILGTGIVPGGAIGQEQQNLLRRVFAKSVIVALYQSSPLLAMLLRSAEKLSGGLSPFTQPVQVSPYTSGAWVGAAGTFNLPQDQAGEVNAEFNLCAELAAIPYFGLESLVSQDAVAVASRLGLKVNDLKNANIALLSTALFGSNAANPNYQMYGLLDCYDDGTTVPTYGGLNRTTYPAWKGTKVTSAGAIQTRVGMIPKIIQTAKANGGEAPDFGVLSMEDWTALLTDYMGIERYEISPRGEWGKTDPVNSGFRGLMLGNTPIFFDPNLAQGTGLFINSRYLGLAIHENANFAWTGWHSTIANGQIGYLGLQVTAANLICKKPSTGMIIEGMTATYTW